MLGDTACTEGVHKWQVRFDGDETVIVGVAKASASLKSTWENNDSCWGVCLFNRKMVFAKQIHQRGLGPFSFHMPCTVTLTLDCSAGTLRIRLTDTIWPCSLRDTDLGVICTSLPQNETFHLAVSTQERACRVKIQYYKVVAHANTIEPTTKLSMCSITNRNLVWVDNIPVVVEDKHPSDMDGTLLHSRGSSKVFETTMATSSNQPKTHQRMGSSHYPTAAPTKLLPIKLESKLGNAQLQLAPKEGVADGFAVNQAAVASPAATAIALSAIAIAKAAALTAAAASTKAAIEVEHAKLKYAAGEAAEAAVGAAAAAREFSLRSDSAILDTGPLEPARGHSCLKSNTAATRVATQKGSPSRWPEAKF
jgi:hypothetical protein